MADTSGYGGRAPARARGPDGVAAPPAARAHAYACAVHGRRARRPSRRTRTRAPARTARAPSVQPSDNESENESSNDKALLRARNACVERFASVASTIFSALALKIGVFPQEKRYFFFIFYKISKKFCKK